MFNFGMDSVFQVFWEGIFNVYDTIVSSSAEIITFLTRPISDLIGDNLLGNLVGLVLPDMSLITLMLGTGILVYIGFVLVKFFVGIVTGS